LEEIRKEPFGGDVLALKELIDKQDQFDQEEADKSK
jgi:hypothetical protein